MNPSKEELARRFSRLLFEHVGFDKMNEVFQRNLEESDPSICHSHDFCDANQVMIDAWVELTGEEPRLIDEEHTDVIKDAWNLAKEEDFYFWSVHE